MSKFKMGKTQPRDSILEHAVMHTMTHALPKEEQEKLITEYRDNPEGWEITLTINGREADMQVWLDHVDKGYDEAVRRAAYKLVEEMMSEKMSPIWGMLADFERAVRLKVAEVLDVELPER